MSARRPVPVRAGVSGRRSRGGEHRHRQQWLHVVCPCCGQTADARRTLPGRPLHVVAHLTADGVLCGCATAPTEFTP